ncbi:MAG: hypothetical protein WAN93_11615 [Solirubrobacteraceae bacterium]
MAHRKNLNEKQLEVLRWIADGSPQGVMDGDSHRISAAALRNRGLVTTSGRGQTWAARITTAGRTYLKHADGPTPPIPRQANTSVTEQLVNDVIAAGGSLRVPRKNWSDRNSVDYANRARLAEQYGKVPPGKHLTVKMVSAEDVQIDLVDAPEGTVEDAPPIPIPVKVARYHSVVQQFREHSERHEVSRAALPRTLRILQGLVVEAERRGYNTQIASAPERDRYGYHSEWKGAHHGHVVIAIGDYSAAVRVTEEGLQSRTYWKQRNSSYFRDTKTWNARVLDAYEANTTGHLQMQLATGYSQRSAKWADRKSTTLEELLPDLLREIEMRAIEDEHHRQAAERKAAERERVWEAAMRRARERHAEHHRGEVLRTEIARWSEAQRIRTYCSAAESTHTDVPETLKWIAWARSYADTIDPLQRAPGMPAAPTSVQPEELRPFLDGWSPYGPEGRG